MLLVTQGKPKKQITKVVMLESTSKFRVLDIIYNNGDFAIARGYWENQTNLSLACRWHDDGIGYPQTFGKPQWMMFPKVSVQIVNALDGDKSPVVLTFPQVVSN